MSVKVMSYVWDHSRQTGTHLLMMLALADHANDAGQCWPVIERLAKKCRVNRRQARKILKTLEEEGEIHIERGHGRGHPSIYTVKGVAQDLFSKKGAPENPFHEERGSREPLLKERKGAPENPFHEERGSREPLLKERKGVLQDQEKGFSSAPALKNARGVLREPSLEPSEEEEEDKEEPPPAGAGSPPGGKRARRKTTFPTGSGEQAAIKAKILTATLTAWCHEKGLTFNLEEQWEAFAMKAQANGYTYLDWSMAFKNWLKSPYQTVSKTKPVRDPNGFLKFVTIEGAPR